MADQHHLNLLRRGIDAWNEWRANHPHVLDLHEAEQDCLDLVKQGKDAWHQWSASHGS